MDVKTKDSAQPGLEWAFRFWVVLSLMYLATQFYMGLVMVMVGIPLISARLKLPQWGLGLESSLSKRYLTQFLILGALMMLIGFVGVTALVAATAFAFFKASLVGVRSVKPQLLVIVDGQCSLCLASVRFLYAARWQSSFRVTEFGSELARQLGKPVKSDEATSLELVEFNALGVVKSTLTHSEAVLRLAEECGPVWKAVAFIAKMLPRSWLDNAYRWIADHRRRFKGPTLESCPTEFRQKAFEFFAQSSEFMSTPKPQ
jgi:predicted DCC family thiol-disulfide oxidoreductase YuxK